MTVTETLTGLTDRMISEINTLMSAGTGTPAGTVTTMATGSFDFGLVIGAFLSGAVIAALITGIVTALLAWSRSRQDERGRLHANFASTFAAYSAYKELPYAIRRRRGDVPGEERVRLSEALREIQAQLAYHQAWTLVESRAVGEAYADLVQQLRQVAGKAMHDAWNAPPSRTDEAMNIPRDVIDLTPLAQHEETYLRAVQTHLQQLTPWWARRHQGRLP